MADAKGLQELISYFETDDKPTADNFSAFINSVVKVINGTFTDTAISPDGAVTLSYGTSTVNGATVDTEIAEPLYALFKLSADTQWSLPTPIEKLTTKTCSLLIGTQLPAGTYKYILFYQN